MKITKEITFDSAHLLSNYDGKCNNLHGHTYKLQVTLEGEVDSKSGMLLDFNKIKEVLNVAILQHFDHAIIFSSAELQENSEKELLLWACKFNKKYIELPEGKSTCENMAPIIKAYIRVYLKNIKVENLDVSVKLWETPTSFAEC